MPGHDRNSGYHSLGLGAVAAELPLDLAEHSQPDFGVVGGEIEAADEAADFGFDAARVDVAGFVEDFGEQGGEAVEVARRGAFTRFGFGGGAAAGDLVEADGGGLAEIHGAFGCDADEPM